jgi:glycine hydroxymethyltransferase
VPWADIITSTTHKTLRGPRGGLMLCKAAHAKKVDSAVFPNAQGGPLMHIIAAKAVAFQEALQPSFKVYQQQILDNAQALAKALSGRGYRLVSGGTDNHLILVDLRSRNVTGQQAAELLDRIGITVNKNLIPGDPRPPREASGIRLGVPALTTRGLRQAEMERIAEILDQALSNPNDSVLAEGLRRRTLEICDGFPVYPEMRQGKGG